MLIHFRDIFYNGKYYDFGFFEQSFVTVYIYLPTLDNNIRHIQSQQESIDL